MNEICYDCTLPVTTMTDVHDQDGWSGWSYEARWQISTVYSLHLICRTLLVVKWIVALRSLLSFSGGQVDNFWRTSRTQGNEKYFFFSRGSVCWQIRMWLLHNISGDYLYNDELRLQYTITALKGLHQVMHGIFTILITINGKDCTGTLSTVITVAGA